MARLWLRDELFEHVPPRKLCKLTLSDVRGVTSELRSRHAELFTKADFVAAVTGALGWNQTEAELMLQMYRCFVSSAVNKDRDDAENRIARLSLFLFVQTYSKPASSPSARDVNIRWSKPGEGRSPTHGGSPTHGSHSPTYGSGSAGDRSPRSPTYGSPTHGSPRGSPEKRSPTALRGAALSRRSTEAACRLAFVKRALPDVLELLLGGGAPRTASRAQVDDLGFLINGGPGFRRQAAALSGLVPWWAAGDDDAAAGMPLQALQEWAERSLTINEVAYPPPGASSLKKLTAGMAAVAVDEKRAQGAAVRALPRPLVIEEINRATAVVLPEDTEGPESDLSLLGCHKAYIYVLAPVRFASIAGCTNCTVVVGAVSGCITFTHCEAMRIVVAAHCVRLSNCVDCDLFTYTPTRPLFMGDCRAMRVGPYNSSYPALRRHLVSAGLVTAEAAASGCAGNLGDGMSLAALGVGGEPDAKSSGAEGKSGRGEGKAGGKVEGKREGKHEGKVAAAALPAAPQQAMVGVAKNCWDSPLENVSSSAGNRDRTSAQLLRPEQMSEFAVPVSMAGGTSSNPFLVPPAYREALQRRRAALASVQTQIHNATQELGPEKCAELQAAISGRFHEWLVSTRNARQLMDLVRMARSKD